MNSGRLKQLLRFLEEDPNDAFTLYAVALEYQHNEPKKAEELFARLIKTCPDYLPSYYMAAMLKIKLGKLNEAIGLIEKGMDLAVHCNDLTTLRELKEAYLQIRSD